MRFPDAHDAVSTNPPFNAVVAGPATSARFNGQSLTSGLRPRYVSPEMLLSVSSNAAIYVSNSMYASQIGCNLKDTSMTHLLTPLCSLPTPFYTAELPFCVHPSQNYPCHLRPSAPAHSSGKGSPAPRPPYAACVLVTLARQRKHACAWSARQHCLHLPCLPCLGCSFAEAWCVSM